MAGKVAFTAVAEHGGAVGPHDGDTTLVFNTIITNIGGGYDNSTGVFTAPYAGLYYFTFSYHAGKQYKTGLQLIKGDQMIVRTDDINTDQNRIDNAGNSALLELQRGDKVFVCLPAGHCVWSTGHLTSFTGFLVSRI